MNDDEFKCYTPTEKKACTVFEHINYWTGRQWACPECGPALFDNDPGIRHDMVLVKSKRERAEIAVDAAWERNR